MNVEELFNEAKDLNYGINLMIPVKEMRGPGFFPGCIGTTYFKNDLENLPVMVVGQDFDTEENHEKIDNQKGEIEENTTWRNLKKLLEDIKIDVNKSFFTNAYMGLRPQNEKGAKTKNTGKSPAAKKGAEDFAKQCYTFFKVQIKVIKPEIVLVLGKETASFLAKAFKGEFKKWENIGNLKSFYEIENNLLVTHEFDGRKMLFVFVIHPSLNNTNRSIIWGTVKGKVHEQAILKKYIPEYLKTQ